MTYIRKRKYRDWSPDEIDAANKARGILSKAIRWGKIVRPDHCQECGKKCIPEGHHSDYNKPLQVRWLCRTPCHASADIAMRQKFRLNTEELKNAEK